MLHIKQNNSGFTLIELLVAIVILVTLSTGAFVGYSGYTMSSRDSSRISDLKNLYQGIQVASSQLGEAPRPDSALKIYSSTGVLLSEQ